MDNLKQVARSLYLLGKHKAASDVYDEAAKIAAEEDWEIYHNKGLCFAYMRRYDDSVNCFRHANDIAKHDTTYRQLGRVHTLREDYRAAAETYHEALEFSPDSAEILTALGLLYLRMGENYRAFDYLGNSLTHDPKDAKTILAAGSIIQDHEDVDVALVKYRVAAQKTPDSPQLWNNVGMCFFGKKRYIANIACLKRRCTWTRSSGSWRTTWGWCTCARAARERLFFSACANLKPDFASCYAYLAVTLARLDDFDNACAAYEKAISMEKDHVFHLNYAVTLHKNGGDERRCREQLAAFDEAFAALDEEAKNADPEVQTQAERLRAALG